MTKLMVPPRPEGSESPDEKKDLEKDPKVFTVVNPSPAIIPIQIPPPEPKKVKSQICGFVSRCLLIVTLLCLFALALIMLFGGSDGLRTVFGQNSVRHVIIVDEPQQFSLQNDRQKVQKPLSDEQKKPEEVQVEVTMEVNVADTSTQAPLIPSVTNLNMMDTVLNVMNAVKNEIENSKMNNQGVNTSAQMHVVMSNNLDGPAMVIISSDDGDSNEEQGITNTESKNVEGGNVMDYNSNLIEMEMRRQQALRMWRLRRIQQVLFEQQMMREMIGRAIMQKMVEEQQEQRQAEFMEQQQRAAQWQNMQIVRAQHEQMLRQQQMQKQMMLQQQMQQEQAQQHFWAQQRAQPEFWPRPENVLFRAHWSPQEEQQQQWARYWQMQREAQMMQQQRAAQEQQWQQWRWQQEQQARAQAMVAAQQQAQEARMIQAQQEQQQIRMQQIAQNQQQQEVMQEQQLAQQAQTQMEQRQQLQPQSPTVEPKPEPHSVLFFRPLHWQHVEPQQPEEQKEGPIETTNENGVPVPVRPHDASAQLIVNNMQAQQLQPENPVLPSIADRIYQKYQQISQNFQSGAEFRPTYSVVPVETPEEAAENEQPIQPYDHDSIYKEMLRKSLEIQQKNDNENEMVTEAPPAERTTQAEIEETTEPIVIEDTFPRLGEETTLSAIKNSVSDIEEKADEEMEGSGEAMDPLAEFFKYFETEAVKLSQQAKADVNKENAARVIDNSPSEKTVEAEMPTPLPLVLNAEVDESEPHMVNVHKPAALVA